MVVHFLKGLVISQILSGSLFGSHQIAEKGNLIKVGNFDAPELWVMILKYCHMVWKTEASQILYS